VLVLEYVVQSSSAFQSVISTAVSMSHTRWKENGTCRII